jgi:serine protease
MPDAQRESPGHSSIRTHGQRRPGGKCRRLLAALAAGASLTALPATASADSSISQPSPAPRYTGNYIVRWASTQNVTDASAPTIPMSDADRIRGVLDASGILLSVKRQMSGQLQLLGAVGGGTDPEAIAARLRQDPRIADAVPDRWLHLHDTTPNDPEFGTAQQYLAAPAVVTGGVDLPAAWDRSRGSSNIVIAVVDTGYLPHPDLLARLVPGYDFISNASIANDGDGRDADPTDAGDGITAGFTCPDGTTPAVAASSWHGTRVASVLGAITDNGTNIAGVDWNARLQPVRVSGRCGALLSDTVDGMRWAGGLSVPGVPDNPTPARVINISLGGGTCSSIEQQAVSDLNAAGVVVVAAAGNASGAVEAPADCSGVIAVTAHANDGENASYANTGTQIAISAPGGGCGNSKVSLGGCTVPLSYIRTLSNTGALTPDTFTVTSSMGTSFSAPMVSGVVSLMLALAPSLTPAAVLSALQSSARPHPAGTYCTVHQGVCGAGLLDANAALTAALASTSNPVTTPAAPATTATTSSSGGGGGTWPAWGAAGLLAAGLLGYGWRRRATRRRR